MANREPRLALIHHAFGPYHLARARALRDTFPGTVLLLQLAASESLRAWRPDVRDLHIDTVAEGVLETIPSPVIVAAMARALDRLQPNILAIAGYAHPAMRRAAAWARPRRARAILMSDSQAKDRPRRRVQEWLKRRWTSRYFQAAFVSGAAAACYAESLGIAAHRIWRGYDVVDNDYFARESRLVRARADTFRAEMDVPARFFLYVGRFAPEKNLLRLVRAFGLASANVALRDWSLVLVGGGSEEDALRRQAADLGARVRFVPFQQIEQLPRYYGLAAALVLPSLSEPWGLVVNEAMACGLPVLLSRQCGSALDMVFPGVNGLVFDPEDVEDMAAALVAMAGDAESRRRFGEASARIVDNFSPQTWAAALTACALAGSPSHRLRPEARVVEEGTGGGLA